MRVFVLIATGLQLLLSCSGQSSKQHPQNIEAADSIVIGFKDASVPPPNHRSYEMIFTHAKAQYRLYAYDSTLLVQAIPFSKTQLDELIALLRQYQIKPGKPKGQTKGCTGGTSRYVQGFMMGKAALNGSVYYCGSEEDGNIAGNLTALCQEAKKYFSKAPATDRD